MNWRKIARALVSAKIEKNSSAGDGIQLKIVRFSEKGDFAIWQVKARYEQVEGAGLAFSCVNKSGTPLDFELYLLERQVVCEGDCDVVYAAYSLELKKDVRSFSLVARLMQRDGESEAANKSGSFSMNPGYYGMLVLSNWRAMRNACTRGVGYKKWLKRHRASRTELARQASATLPQMPRFSIIVPCFASNEAFLRACVSSVTMQSYPLWELILVDAGPDGSSCVRKVADEVHDDRIIVLSLDANRGIAGNTNFGITSSSGDWVAFLDHDDVIEPDALYCYAKAISDDPEVSVLFCDEDSFSHKNDYRFPAFKECALNVDLLYSHNYVTHFLAVKRSILEEVGLSSDDVSGAQDYDLTLRLLAHGCKFSHIPRVLYHWRQHAGSSAGDNMESKPYAEEAGRLALQRHFDQRGIAGKVETTEHPFVYRMRYALPDPKPLVSIIIPNKDHIEELDACIRSIVTKSSYREFEIVVVENNSKDVATFEYYERIQNEFDQIRVITWIPPEPGYFNYSAIINHGVANSRGSRLLLLNNDTKVITEDFIEEMLGYLERPEVGVVGAKLYFRDGLVQHAGIEVGPLDKIIHVNQNFTRERAGYRARAIRPGNFSAVTGACQMVRREVFDEVGGYDERFAVGFNDADFCLRVGKAGYLTVFTPYAELYHYEFTSRGREEVDDAKQKRWEAERALFKNRWTEYFEQGDPFSNPNLSLKSCYYALAED